MKSNQAAYYAKEVKKLTEPKSKAQYTPGPWQAEPIINGIRIVSGPISITQMHTDGDTSQANAALIAAAPDLLIELKYVMAATSSYWSDELILRVTGVIAKAEGKGV